MQRRLILLFALVSGTAFGGPETGGRSIVSLDGSWQFQTNGAPGQSWKTVQLPASFESHEGTNFNGVGWYKKILPSVALPPDHRLLLHFDAAATEAGVWWNGHQAGHHLGGWTPFRIDVTPWVQQSAAGGTNEIVVRLDEKVGHNTQGFLPIVEPHFGGIWQSVHLLTVPETHLDDLKLRALGNPQTRRLLLDVPVLGAPSNGIARLTIRYRLLGAKEWRQSTFSGRQLERVTSPSAGSQEASSGDRQTYHLEIALRDPAVWSPAHPNLYEVEVSLPNGDRVATRAAFRSTTTRGRALLLNGAPLNVRGLLNWGYHPPGLAPNPGEAAFREELAMARARGFNLMKFCLWVPPARYLELADEMGMLTWMEYPTWHPNFGPAYLDPLRAEFREFFARDRNHPSIILRSLTCETGPGADLNVIRSLYDLAHQMIPGALVEDDSSWIQWNRITDFYDDHPYGNNHTWVPTLLGLDEYIRTHSPKPLVLGEAMAADTWVHREALEAQVGRDRPFWLPYWFDGQPRWKARMKALYGPAGLDRLRPDSLRYAMLMRKYQAETFRRELPEAGYVISVIRDVPTASMGLIDYEGQPKWSAADWAWQRDTICLLRTEGDTRSFFGGRPFHGKILVSHYGPGPLTQAVVTVELHDKDGARLLGSARQEHLQLPSGTLRQVLNLDLPLPAVTRPVRLRLKGELRSGDEVFRNEWPLWLMPSFQPMPPVLLHSSLDPALGAELFPEAKPMTGLATNSVVVAARFDDDLVRLLEAGGRVLLLPDGRRHSLPLAAHWFLRGAPFIPESAFLRRAPRELFIELQHFDLGADVIPDLTYLDQIDPILLLWDTHDRHDIKTHGLVFKTQAGEGRLLVSALHHRSASNAAGRWLLRQMVEELYSGPAPQHRLTKASWARLKAKLHEEKIPLTDRDWQFRPDPDERGARGNWSSPDFTPDASWKPIRVGRSWESQGWPSLDGWACYRLSVHIPDNWSRVYLTFEGVDDIYELFINGKQVGKGGDLATRQSSFFEKKSHNITQWAKPGEDCVIGVRVYDWYGAGGVFQPVTLGTTPYVAEGEILK